MVADTYFKDGRWYAKQPEWVRQDAVNIAWRNLIARIILRAMKNRTGVVVARGPRRYRYERYHGRWSAWWFLRHSQWCQDLLDGLDINITGPKLLRMLDDGKIDLDGAGDLVRAA